MPTLYDLVFWKEGGNIKAALRVRTYQESKPQSLEKRKVYETFFELDGRKKYAAVVYGVYDYKLLKEDTEAGMQSRTAGCDVQVTTTHTFSCEGNTANTTICYYRTRTTMRTICSYSSGEPGEWETPEPGEGGGGWSEYESSIEEYQNETVIDSLQGYPCAQDVLKQLPNMDSLTKQILREIFGVNEDVNLKFSPSSTLPFAIDGTTTCSGGSIAFDCTIRLNTHVLTNSSKDYMVAVFIHEAIHAYITYQRNMLGANSQAFKDMFPIYGDYQGNDPQHNEMANNYINKMASVIKGFNPSISDMDARALAWGGLEMTSVWQNQDTTSIHQMNSRAKSPSPADYINYNLKKCD